MDEDYGGNYITIEDEDGQEFELEQLDTLEYNDSEYALFLPADMEEDDPDYGYIILRIEEHDGEEFYCSSMRRRSSSQCTTSSWRSCLTTRIQTRAGRVSSRPFRICFVSCLCVEQKGLPF